MKQVALSRQPKNANPLLINLSGLHRIPAKELNFSNMFDDDDGLEAELWDLIDEFCKVTPPVKAISLDSLFESQMSVRLATAFLAFQKQQQSSSILSPDQLTAIARGKKGDGLDHDIDSWPGVYIFSSLASREVLKVGQAGDMQTRIADGHLRYGYLCAHGGLHVDVICMLRSVYQSILGVGQWRDAVRMNGESWCGDRLAAV